jgi:hypothetical protein
LKAARRMRIVATALALAEAKDADVHVNDIGRRTNATPDQVRQALAQYEYASYVISDDGYSEPMNNGLHVHRDGRITVQDPWLMDEWQPTLPQALRLYVSATTAISLSSHTDPAPDPNSHLQVARQKLAKYLGQALGLQGSGAGRALRQLIEVAAPDTPPTVRKLKSIIDSGQTAWIIYEAPARTTREIEAEIDPLQLRLVGDQWRLQGRIRQQRVVHRPSKPDTEEQPFEVPTETTVVSIPVAEVHEVRSGEHPVEPIAEGFDVAHEPIEVKLTVHESKVWLLDPFPMRKRYSSGDRQVNATVEISNEVELRTLLLRLGTEGFIRRPKSSAQQRQASPRRC